MRVNCATSIRPRTSVAATTRGPAVRASGGDCWARVRRPRRMTRMCCSTSNAASTKPASCPGAPPATPTSRSSTTKQIASMTRPLTPPAAAANGSPQDPDKRTNLTPAAARVLHARAYRDAGKWWTIEIPELTQPGPNGTTTTAVGGVVKGQEHPFRSPLARGRRARRRPPGDRRRGDHRDSR